MAHVTVPSAAAIARYAVTSAQTDFTVPFTFFSPADLVVTRWADSVGTLIPFAREPGPDQFSVAGEKVDGGFDGGTITIGGDGVANCTLTILRFVLPERVTDFPYPATSIDIRSLNTDLDRETAMISDMREFLSRTLHVPELSEIDTTLPLPLKARRALLVNAAATGFTFSTYDPDTTVPIAQEALADAQEALDKANAALAMAAGAGVGSRKSFGPIVLVAGVQKYPLPEAVAKPADVDLYYGGAYQTDQWEITNEFGVGMTLTLFPQVVAENPTDEQWLAGMKIWGKLTSGLTSSAIGNEIIQERHIASGAINLSGRLIVAGPANKMLRTDDDGKVNYGDLPTSPASLEWVNVKDHGAIGLGPADDTAAIRLAVEALPVGRPGVLYFPPGYYGVSDTITISNESTIYICGMPRASVIVPLTPDKDIFLLENPYVQIEGITFESAAGYRSGGAAIKINNGSISRIRLCDFIRQCDSIWATDAFGATLTIESCGIYDSTPGVAHCIRIDAGFDVAISDLIISNHLDAMPFAGITISAAGDVEIINASVLCCQYGLNVFVPAGKTVASLWIMFSFFDNCGRGGSFIADGGSIVRSVLTQCWFSSAHTDDGFFLSIANGGVIDGVSFSNCDFYGNVRNGLMAYSPGIKNIDIAGSRAAGNGQNGFIFGFAVGGAVSDWSITSSFAGAGYGWPGNGAYGVYAVAGASRYTVGMNRLRGNGLGATSGINFAAPVVGEVVFGNQT